MCKGEDEESEKTEKKDREKEGGRGGDSLNLAFTCAWQTRNADDTGIVLSLVLSVRSRGSRILLVGRLLQHLSFACYHDEDIDLTPRYTRIAREQGALANGYENLIVETTFHEDLPMDIVPANLISTELLPSSGNSRNFFLTIPLTLEFSCRAHTANEIVKDSSPG